MSLHKKKILKISNLLVNRARWNILDENIDNSYARWWHDGTIMREPDKLTSGLIGPVKVLPFTPVKVADVSVVSDFQVIHEPPEPSLYCTL